MTSCEPRETWLARLESRWLCTVAAAIVGAGVATAAGSVISSSNAASAAGSAASEQAGSADFAAQVQQGMFAQTQNNLSPFIKAGGAAVNELGGLTGGWLSGTGDPLSPGQLTSQFQPTINQLEQTPGYQFTLDQGLKATQNSYAAQGLGSSGAAAKGATNYAEGLASTTYQQQFQNFQASNLQTYNMLSNLAGLGENAGANLGNTAATVGANVGADVVGAGNASAAGTIGAANALTAGISGATGAGSNAALLLALQNNGLFGNPSSGSPGSAFPNSSSDFGAVPVNSLQA